MQRAIRIELEPSPAQATVLTETSRQFTAVFNAVCAYGWQEQVSNGVRLHHALYYPLKADYPDLVSDLHVQARVKATEAVKSALANPSDSMLATADGTLRLVRAFQGWPTGFLRAETVAEATRNQVGDLGGGIIGFLEWPQCPWGLGPELYGAKTPHWAPAQAGADSFGHAGASGCMAWVAPAEGIAWSIHGTRHFANWLVQRGPIIGAAILAALRQ
jgi:hypothetical protein